MKGVDWATLKDHIENGKSVIDVGCGDGDLAREYLERRNGTILGVEISPEAFNSASSINPKRFKVLKSIDGIDEVFDYGFYFGLHFMDGIDFLPWLSKHCKTLFTHSARVKDEPEFNENYRIHLKSIFKSVVPIGIETLGQRMVFKCC
jgi:SAM-dependent methyltransferase